ncbi:hypothetical protein BV22DRAFT_882004 [Leucogyrophana mollusca]|uniref:Uncharacterized protein n=1 Tax=Leucogyrophana mollusca TaxID=85980 RepID=A0ACB8B0M9_9AGAM|nr:hypothetical protein BV22DRAFT_882004 [Leucogyrophana mollusca]
MWHKERDALSLEHADAGTFRADASVRERWSQRAKVGCHGGVSRREDSRREAGSLAPEVEVILNRGEVD